MYTFNSQHVLCNKQTLNSILIYIEAKILCILSFCLKGIAYFESSGNNLLIERMRFRIIPLHLLGSRP